MDLDRRLDPEIAAALASLPILDLSDIPAARRTMLERRAAAAAELHVYPGGSHAFESYAPGSALARRFVRDRDEALSRAFAV